MDIVPWRVDSYTVVLIGVEYSTIANQMLSFRRIAILCHVQEFKLLQRHSYALVLHGNKKDPHQLPWNLVWCILSNSIVLWTFLEFEQGTLACEEVIENSRNMSILKTIRCAMLYERGETSTNARLLSEASLFCFRRCYVWLKTYDHFYLCFDNKNLISIELWSLWWRDTDSYNN